MKRPAATRIAEALLNPLIGKSVVVYVRKPAARDLPASRSSGRPRASPADPAATDGGVPWPEGHVDAWNHIECLMALTVAGLREPVRRATTGSPGTSAPTARGR